MGKIILLLILVIGIVGSVVFFVVAFDTDNDTEESETYSTSSIEEQTTQQKPQESVEYTALFDALWNTDDHTTIPDGAHFSPFVAWTHVTKDDNSVFEVGGTASEGMKLMAETGDTTILKQELDALKTQGRVGEYVIGEVIFSPAQSEQELLVTQDHRYVSVVSMIAPSPDWFVAVQGVNMFPDRQWTDYSDIPLNVYDAGTDSGEGFNSPNQETIPRGIIHSLVDDGINVEEGGGVIAQFSLVQKEV